MQPSYLECCNLECCNQQAFLLVTERASMPSFGCSIFLASLLYRQRSLRAKSKLGLLWYISCSLACYGVQRMPGHLGAAVEPGIGSALKSLNCFCFLDDFQRVSKPPILQKGTLAVLTFCQLVPVGPPGCQGYPGLPQSSIRCSFYRIEKESKRGTFVHAVCTRLPFQQGLQLVERGDQRARKQLTVFLPFLPV